MPSLWCLPRGLGGDPGLPSEVREGTRVTKKVRFSKKVVIKTHCVPPGTHMDHYFRKSRTHNGPAEMPTTTEVKMARTIDRKKAKRLEMQVGSGVRICAAATTPDDSPNTAHTWAIDSGACVASTWSVLTN